MLSLAVAAVRAAADRSAIHGVMDLVRLLMECAIAPVGAVVDSGIGDENNPLLHVARALIAIPLVVGALSLRKYVRSSV